jgi:hypothetical protein
VRLLLEQSLDLPLEEVKTIDAKVIEEEPRTSFAPTLTSKNPGLLAEIDKLKSLEKEKEAPGIKPRGMDLNGMKPRELLLGSVVYGLACYAAFQGTLSFMDTTEGRVPSDILAVERASGVGRMFVSYVLASFGAIAGGASLGQFLLAIKVAQLIFKGEVDPNAEPVVPEKFKNKPKVYEKYFAMMKGSRERL